jgi:hypothetical protein
MSFGGLADLGHCGGDGWGSAPWADGLSDLGACPSSNPTVIVEATQIPTLFWWIAGGVALLLLLKKR